MINIPRSNLKKRKVTFGLKFLIVISLVVGFWFRSCWNSNELENIIFENIFIENITNASVDVCFEIYNRTRQARSKLILIEVITTNNEVIAKKMIKADIKPLDRTNHFARVDKFERMLAHDERLVGARVRLYQRKLL